MTVTVLKTAAWISFAVGILFAWIELDYDKVNGPHWISALINLVIFWTIWFFLLRAALNREKRGD